MPSIVLVNPRGYRLIGDKSLPLGLIFSSVYLSKEYEIEIIDLRIERNWGKILLKSIRNDPICIGITSMTGKQIGSALEVARFIKNHTKVPVVFGGVHPSLLPSQTMENPLIDIVVQGEGEITFYELVKALEKKGSFEDIKGIWFKQNGKIRYTEPRPFLNFNELPPIPYQCVEVERYFQYGKFGKSISIVTSRGCPEACKFCYNVGSSHRKWRAFSAERVINEFSFFKKEFGVNHIMVHDDNFFADLNRVKEVAEKILHNELIITWEVIGAHPRMMARVEDDMLNLLDKSGLKGVAIGVESGSQEIINFAKKNFKIIDLLQVNRRLANTNIVPTYCFISGWPDEARENLKKTVDLLFRLKRENPKTVYGTIRPVICYPGTELFDLAIQRGFKPPDSLKKWSGYSWYNYMNIDIPWTSRKEKKWLINLYYSTVLMNPEYVFIKSKLFKVFSSFLMPFMKYRVKNLNFKFSILPKILLFIQRHVL